LSRKLRRAIAAGVACRLARPIVQSVKTSENGFSASMRRLCSGPVA